MDRQTYLDRLRDGTTVSYNGTEYMPSAYIMRPENGHWVHTAELKDLKVNSVIVVGLSEVKERESL
jgi:hypothetical protein